MVDHQSWLGDRVYCLFHLTGEWNANFRPLSTTVDGERGVAGRVNDSNGSTRLDGLMLSGGVWWTVRALMNSRKGKGFNVTARWSARASNVGNRENFRCTESKPVRQASGRYCTFLGFFPRDEIWDLRNISIPFSNRATHNSGNGLDSHDGWVIVCSDELGRTASRGSCVNAIHADGIDQLIKQIHRWIDKLQH